MYGYTLMPLFMNWGLCSLISDLLLKKKKMLTFRTAAPHSPGDKMLCSGTSAHTAFLTQSKCSIVTHTWFYGQKMNIYCPKKIYTQNINSNAHFLNQSVLGRQLSKPHLKVGFQNVHTLVPNERECSFLRDIYGCPHFLRRQRGQGGTR